MALTEKLTAVAEAIRLKSGRSELLTLDQMPAEIAGIRTGVELNFEVIPNPRPETAAENTVWVDTDSFTGWTFSPAAPEEAEEGHIWISTGTGENTAFNALKENAITLCPLAAMQYTGGSWQPRTACSYRGGRWTDWYLEEIIARGDVNEKYGFSTNVISASSYNGAVTPQAGSLLMQTSSGNTTIMCTDNKVDLTHVSRIELDVDALTANTHGTNDLLSGLSLVVLSGNRSSAGTATSAMSLVVAQTQTKTAGRQILTIDNTGKALTGSYYIGIILCAYGTGSVGRAEIYHIRCM